MQLNDMKTVCSFWVLCVRFIRQGQGSIYLEVMAGLLLRHALSGHPPVLCESDDTV